jgi:hypothetical protein
MEILPETEIHDIADTVSIDGAHGEGGGQVLRTALALSEITLRPFRIVNIRARRRNPGLLPQHLSATRAAAAITGAKVSGDRLGSSELIFVPSRRPQSGSYTFDVAEIAGKGSAGSAISSCRPSWCRWRWRTDLRRSWSAAEPISSGLPVMTISLMGICPLCGA